MSLYCYKKIFYYNHVINTMHHYGWYYSAWLSICIISKTLLNLNNITIFILLGLILITFGFYINNKDYEFRLLTELNIVEKNSLKNIEEYSELLLKLSKSKDQTDRILVNGIIQKFEEYLNNNVELKAQYNKFVTDKNLQKKFPK